VRNAASILARSLRGVTLRLVDASLSPPADAAAAVAVVLPLMIEQGLGSSVTEVQCDGDRGGWQRCSTTEVQCDRGAV